MQSIKCLWPKVPLSRRSDRIQKVYLDGASRRPRGFTLVELLVGLHSWQQQADQHANDRDHDEEIDEGKARGDP